MKNNKAIKYRIYPNAKQEGLFVQTFGCVRKVYNECLAHQEELYVKGERHLSDFSLKGWVCHILKGTHDYLREVDKFALEESAKSLNAAYDRFFKGLGGHPKFKSKRKSRKSYTTNYTNNNIEVGEDYIKLPKIGRVKATIHRTAPDNWKLKSATISQSGSGKFYVSVLYEYEENIEPVKVKTVLGLDYKSNGLYLDSDNYSPGSPRYTHKYAKKLAREQRRLSKKQGYRKGEPVSNNFLKQQLKVNRIHEKIANSRLDFLHKESLSIAKKADCVCVEDINMTEIAHAYEFRNYRKVTYDNGFGLFRILLEYKLTDRGKVFIKVPKDYPSSKMCHVCGHVLEELDITQKTWICPECGEVHDRDLNAAINLRNYAMKSVGMV